MSGETGQNPKIPRRTGNWWIPTSSTCGCATALANHRCRSSTHSDLENRGIQIKRRSESPGELLRDRSDSPLPPRIGNRLAAQPTPDRSSKLFLEERCLRCPASTGFPECGLRLALLVLFRSV